MAILDAGNEVGIGFDFARQLVAHDFDEVIAGEQISCLTVGQSLLGQEHQGHHHERHVMVPGVEAAH